MQRVDLQAKYTWNAKSTYPVVFVQTCVDNNMLEEESLLNIIYGFPPFGVPAGWVSEVDPTSGKAYYINAATKERQWHRPSDTGTSSGWVSKVDPASGKTYYVNKRTKETQWQPPSETQPEDITTHNIERVLSGRGA